MRTAAWSVFGRVPSVMLVLAAMVMSTRVSSTVLPGRPLSPVHAEATGDTADRVDDCDDEQTGGRPTLARPIACAYTTPRGSFGTAPPALAGNNPKPPAGDPTTAGPGGTTSDGGASAKTFGYFPPGDLVAQDKGRGRTGDRKIYLPGIVFPLKLQAGMDATPAGRHAHMNSQIWGYGGGGWNGHGAAGGSECDRRNYDPMLQRDTFCEVRGWDMPMCPAGQGHQGQDIRPPGCDDDKWQAVAVVDGVITQVTSNTTVRLKGGDGTEYYYLHMHPDSITVSEGDVVTQGQVLGRISNFMNGGRDTTHHLHFQVKQSITIGTSVSRVYVPVYASLIAAYRRSKGLDAGVDGTGNLSADASYEIGAKPDPVTQPPFSLWPVPNVAGFDERPVPPIDLARAFRRTDPASVVTFAATGLPAGLSVDAATGLITGSFDARASAGGDAGVYATTATATTATGATAKQSFTITVAPSLPVVTTATASKTFREGDPVLIAAGAAFADPNVRTLTFDATGLPDGLTFDRTTGRISGAAAAGAAAAKPDGVYAVAVTAANDLGRTASENFTLKILPQKVPDRPIQPPAAAAPVIVGPLPQIVAFAGQELASIDLARYFKAGAGDTGALQFVASRLPAGLNLNATTGQLTGTLAQTAADPPLDVPVVITVSNSAGGKVSQSLVLSLRTQPPTIGVPTVNKTYGEAETVLINAGGAFNVPAGSTVTFAATGLPPGVTIEAVHGTIAGVLPAGSSSGGDGKGVYTVRVTATDQRAASASEAFAIDVLPLPPQPQPPLLKGTPPAQTSRDGDDFAALDMSAYFAPAGVPGSTGPLVYAATGLPPALTLNATNGVIGGKLGPTASQGGTPAGTYQATLIATDTGNGLSAMQSLRITIAAQAPASSDQGWWSKVKNAAWGAWSWATK